MDEKVLRLIHKHNEIGHDYVSKPPPPAAPPPPYKKKKKKKKKKKTKKTKKINKINSEEKIIRRAKVDEKVLRLKNKNKKIGHDYLSKKNLQAIEHTTEEEKKELDNWYSKKTENIDKVYKEEKN